MPEKFEPLANGLLLQEVTLAKANTQLEKICESLINGDSWVSRLGRWAFPMEM